MLAVRRSKFLRAIRKMGTEVNAEKKLFKPRNTKADAFVYRPKRAKTPASRYGYTGVSNAVGPVSAQYGFAYPFPSAMERATRPIS